MNKSYLILIGILAIVIVFEYIDLIGVKSQRDVAIANNKECTYEVATWKAANKQAQAKRQQEIEKEEQAEKEAETERLKNQSTIDGILYASFSSDCNTAIKQGIAKIHAH